MGKFNVRSIRGSGDRMGVDWRMGERVDVGRRSAFVGDGKRKGMVLYLHHCVRLASISGLQGSGFRYPRSMLICKLGVWRVP